MFTPGSHLVDSGPPDEWNAPLQNGELPYSGPQATVLEAPSGSMILYDARTWHRAGYNRSDHKRGMMATNYATGDGCQAGTGPPANACISAVHGS